jgi:fatty acid synthase subunit beta
MVEQEMGASFGSHQVCDMSYIILIKVSQPFLIYISDGTIHIDTPYSRLLGKAPIMVAGMTPSTVKGGFISAILSAGFHVELAGGGHYDAAALRAKVTKIQSKIPPGVGITLNSLYINPQQFSSSSHCGRT